VCFQLRGFILDIDEALSTGNFCAKISWPYAVAGKKGHRATGRIRMTKNGVLILMASTALVLFGYESFGQSLDDSAARAQLAT
jgi:hypothetical protein